MKNKLFLRLCLIMTVLLSFQSCRQDLLPEKETYNNSGAFQLTSKRISLNESKHKAKLLPELKKAEVGIKAFGKNNAQGKLVNYANGVSIDTESVIYIENGPNFHTYTFNITRENAPADAPVENLLLTPLADGTYKEFLVTYHLTPQEKENISNGYYFYSGTGTTISELAAGTFNGSGQLAKLSCGWTSETIWTACSSGEHSGSNFQSCEFLTGTGGTPPSAYTVSTYSCADVKDNTIEQTPSPIGGGGSVGGGGECSDCPSNTTPVQCVQVPTDPTQPSSGMVDENGCAIGLPTLPNVRPPTPCAKIKAQREDTEFGNKTTDLQGKTGLTKETGYIQKWGGSYEYQANAGATGTANTLHLPEVVSNTWIKAFMHTHVDDNPNSEKKGIKMFSPADAVYLMDLVQNAQTNGHSLSDPYAVMVTSIGNYQIRFTGNKFQIKTFTKVEKDSHNDPFGIFMADFMINSKKLELGFLKYIQKEMLLYGITLYRMNTDGTTTEIKLNADKTDTVENTCP